MSVSFKSILSSSNLNSSFLSRKTDSDTIAKISLNKVSGSGALIDDLQLTVNNKGVGISAVQSIATSGKITILGTKDIEVVKVASTGGSVPLSDAPFLTNPSKDGSLIIVRGTDDTNTVTLLDTTQSGTPYGVKLNGDATLLENYQITLTYDSTDQAYYEVSRNF